MTISADAAHRGWGIGPVHGNVCLTDKFEILKDIGDGSFGTVALGRVRSGGAHVAKRGTMVAIKTMKKTFDSFTDCLELREVVFLRTLPGHFHLVPALDIFLDPLSRKLHIAMEYMDGNLYQLMKAREHKPFDGSVVKSILVQILSGLQHIHSHHFFHRDIKPENILVSVSAREDLGGAFKRYSQLITPPPTPPTYSIKIADFGLAREIHSKMPYTTYVSTRWYRAPEVLLRAGEYSAPVDIWAFGAMAVEVATLKPLFPGGNEVDQVWRVCEIMGSPGNWVNRQGAKVGGGQWKDGVKLAQNLGFSFPKMAPHTLGTILQAPQWPASLCDFVTKCLLWDPNARPTSARALAHEYFKDACDPLGVKPVPTRLLSRKQSDLNAQASTALGDAAHTLTSKTSAWFRKSLIARESAPAVPQYHSTIATQLPSTQTVSLETTPSKMNHVDAQGVPKARPSAVKRSTWANSTYPYGAPMPILPSIRPISPLSNTITAQAHAEPDHHDMQASYKTGQQFSLLSRGVQRSQMTSPESDKSLPGEIGNMPTSRSQRDGFFSHLRKRARRISGRHQFPATPKSGDLDPSMTVTAHTGAGNNYALISGVPAETPLASSFVPAAGESPVQLTNDLPRDAMFSRPLAKSDNSSQVLKRQHSVPPSQEVQPHQFETTTVSGDTADAMRNFCVVRKPILSTQQYETPDEQEELLDGALEIAQAAVARMGREQQRPFNFVHDPRVAENRPPLRMAASESLLHTSYPTPSPTEKRHTIDFEHFVNEVQPMDICAKKQRNDSGYPFPTPPYEDDDWAAAAAAAIIGQQWRG